MAVPTDLQGIPGAVALHDCFGYWPTFHDAEIISLHLNRRGCSSLCVHTWEMTKEIDENGNYVLAKHVVVELVFEGICARDINDFNHQNVIFGLSIEKTNSGFRLTLDECYGLAGSIESKRVSIRIIPGEPS